MEEGGGKGTDTAGGGAAVVVGGGSPPKRSLARPAKKRPIDSLSKEHQDALITPPIRDLEAALGAAEEAVPSHDPQVPPSAPLAHEAYNERGVAASTHALGRVMDELMIYHSQVQSIGLDFDIPAAGRQWTDSHPFPEGSGFPSPILASTSNAPHGFHAFKLNLASLLAMGFDHAAAQDALFRTRNQNVVTAVEWLLTNVPAHGQEEMKTSELKDQRRSIVRSTSYNLGVSSASTSMSPPPPPALEYSITAPADDGCPSLPRPEALGMVPRLNSAAVRRVAEASGGAFGPSDAFTALLQALGDEEQAISILRSRQQDETKNRGQGKPKHAELAIQASNCAICWDDISNGEGRGEGGSEGVAVWIPGCQHTFCKDCVRQWLTVNITEGKVGGSAMRCPLVGGGACDRGELIQEEVEDLIRQTAEGVEEIGQSEGTVEPEPSLLVKYRKFLENQAMEKDSSVRWCPSPGCETAIRPTALGALIGRRRLKCPTCSTAVCGRCGRAYHGWGTCEDLTDATLEQYRKQKFLQPCPNCRRQVEKLDACPHMTCPCGHQWCWVCRGNYPCSALHFGKSGYGSSTEIGDVSGVQRLAVVARMFTVACFLPLLALIVGLGGTAWCMGLFVAPFVLCLAVLVRKARHREEDWDDMRNYEGFKVLAQVIYFAYMGLLVLGASILGVALFFAALALIHAAGALLFPVTCVYLVGEVYSTFQTGISSLNLSLDTTDEARFARCYTDKGGSLSISFVGYGRFSLACFVLAATFFPALAISLCLAPVAPCLLIPICISPRDEFPRVYGMVLGPAAGVATTLTLGFVTSIGWSIAAAGGVLAMILICLWLCIPPLSNCAFCVPVWLFSYSFPLALIIGSIRARQWFAFAPVPDLPIQLPFILVLLACGIVD